MAKQRGRPAVYQRDADRPDLFALKIPPVLAMSLRQAAIARQTTYTAILLKGLQLALDEDEAHTQTARLGDEVATLRQELRTVRGQYTRLQKAFTRAEENHQREMNAPFRRMLSNVLGTDTPLNDNVLLGLINLCHPDKWSQGQPATELAEEVTKQLNTLRKQIAKRIR